MVMIAFAVLDIRDVGHQLDDDRAGIAILAANIATFQLAAAALAAAEIRRDDDQRPAAET
jgi:hypothetical protein